MADIDIDEAKQKEISEFEAKIASVNLFDLLGVAAGASTDEVRRAFQELSRKFHPDRFFGKNLGPFKAKLDTIFRKLVEANQTLSDADKRAAYIAANPFVRAAIRAQESAAPVASRAFKSPEDEARDAERRARLSRHPYLAKLGKVQDLISKAKASMAAGEFSQAYTHVNMALQVDSGSADAKALMNEVRRQNDNARSATDFKRGEDALARGDETAALAAFRSCVSIDPKNGKAAFKCVQLLEKSGADPKECTSYAQKAVDSEPTNIEYRLVLVRLLEAGGMKALAKKHLEEAVRLDPNHPEVKKQGKKRWPF